MTMVAVHDVCLNAAGRASQSGKVTCIADGQSRARSGTGAR